MLDKMSKSPLGFVLILVLSLAPLLLSVWYSCVRSYDNRGIDYSTLDYLIQYQEAPMQFNDPGNIIQVDSIDDVTYRILGDEAAEIYYGNVTIYITPRNEPNVLYTQKLREIGIETHKSPRRVYRASADYVYYIDTITFWGEEIERLP